MNDSSSGRADRVERASQATTLQRHATTRAAAGDAPHVTALVNEIAYAANLVAREVRRAAIAGQLGTVGSANVSGDTQKELDLIANRIFLDCLDATGLVAAVVYEELDEVSPHLNRTIQRIRALGARPAVVINPATPPAVLAEVFEAVGLVVVMTVNPGFGGQRFVPEMLDKVCRTASMLEERNPGCELAVDGGVDARTAPDVVAAGANVLVGGSAIFGHPDGPAAGLRALARAVHGQG